MMLNVPRLTFALAERADFPRFFARVHARFRTPHVSIVLFAVMVWGLAVAGTFRWISPGISTRKPHLGFRCALSAEK